MILFPEGRPAHHETFDEYRAGGGYRPITKNILEEVTASGLRGRGGAGFPVGRKWSIAAGTEADARYVVCNAGEDEPGSFKDRALLEYRPHLVLEGTILAARAISASRAYLYINETYDECFSRMGLAIAEATDAGYLEGVTVTLNAPRRSMLPAKTPRLSKSSRENLQSLGRSRLILPPRVFSANRRW